MAKCLLENEHDLAKGTALWCTKLLVREQQFFESSIVSLYWRKKRKSISTCSSHIYFASTMIVLTYRHSQLTSDCEKLNALNFLVCVKRSCYVSSCCLIFLCSNCAHVMKTYAECIVHFKINMEQGERSWSQITTPE